MALLEVKDLSIQFGGLKAVDSFYLKIEKNQLYGLIGPNGAGKTTVFNLLTGVYKPTGGEARLHQSGVSADEVHADRAHSLFQNLCVFHRIAARNRSQHGNGSHGQTLVDDRNAVHSLDGLAGGNQRFGKTADLFINLVAGPTDIAVRTVQEGNAHGDGADVKILVVDHADGFKDVFCVQHDVLLSDVVHGVEDVLVHYVDLHADFFAESIQTVLQTGEIGVDVGDVKEHDHGEQILHNGLGHVKDVCVVFKADRADLCKDAHGVIADYGDNSFHCEIPLFLNLILLYHRCDIKSTEELKKIPKYAAYSGISITGDDYSPMSM